MVGTPSNDLNIQTAGLIAFDGTSTFSGRTITAGTGISISNGNGVSGNPTISATTSGPTLIQSQTVSGVASVNFTSGFSFNNYQLVITNYKPATNASQLYLQVSVDGGANYISGTYQSMINWATGSSSNGATGIVIGMYLMLTVDSANNTSKGTYNLSNFATNGSGIYPEMTGTCLVSWNGGNFLGGTCFGENTNISSVINAIKIVPSAGNVSQGTFALYGIS